MPRHDRVVLGTVDDLRGRIGRQRTQSGRRVVIDVDGPVSGAMPSLGAPAEEESGLVIYHDFTPDAKAEVAKVQGASNSIRNGLIALAVTVAAVAAVVLVVQHLRDRRLRRRRLVRTVRRSPPRRKLKRR